MGCPNRIYNMDESGMPLDHKLPKVVARKGTRKVHCHTSGNKSQITVLVCANAAGSVVPPMVIFEGQRFSADAIEMMEEKQRKKREEEEAKEQRKREREEKKLQKEEEKRKKAEERQKREAERKRKAEEKEIEKKKKAELREAERKRKAELKEHRQANKENYPRNRKYPTRGTGDGLQQGEISSNECAICFGVYEMT